MPKSVSNAKRKSKRTVKKTSDGIFSVRADLTFGIDSILTSYQIDLAHALFRATLQPSFDPFLLSEKARTRNAVCTRAQMYVQTYCLQQFTFTCMAKHVLGMIIKTAKQKAKPMPKNMHELFFETYARIQSGGAKGKSFSAAIKKPLVFLLLLFYCIADTSVESSSLQTVNPQFSLVSETKPSAMETISLQLYGMKQTESVPVSIKHAIERYDKKMEDEISGIGNALYYLFHSLPPTGEEQIIQYVEEFNDLMNGYAKKATKECRKIVDDAYERDMFANYKTASQIEQLEREYELLMEMKQQNQEETSINLKQTVASAAAAALSGDVFTPFAMMYKTVESVINTPLDKIPDLKPQSTKQTGITSDELWTTSKVYCANSFHLEIEYSDEEQTLKLVGDKISYGAMREFTSSVVMNMKTVQKTTASTQETESVYKSMEQRMKTIEYIVDHLEQMVTMGMMNELGMQIKARSANPIARIRDYFDGQKSWIDATVSTMGDLFPIDARIQREQLIAQEEMARLASKQTSEHTRITSEYYANMINSYSDLIRKPLSATVTSFAATVLDVPADLIETTTAKLSETITHMIGIMMKSSGGIILLSFCTMALVVFMGVALNSIRMIGSMLYMPISPFIWVTKLGVNLGSATIQSVAVLVRKNKPSKTISEMPLNESTDSSTLKLVTRKRTTRKQKEEEPIQITM
jgi:hypothetical protein